MNKTQTPDVVVVGSVAFDSVQTPKAMHEKLLGGSASYTSVASALFAKTGVVGVVGEDFPKEYFGIVVKQGNKVLLDKLNAGLAAIKADGSYAKIYKTWFQAEAPELPAK